MRRHYVHTSKNIGDYVIVDSSFPTCAVNLTLRVPLHAACAVNLTLHFPNHIRNKNSSGRCGDITSTLQKTSVTMTSRLACFFLIGRTVKTYVVSLHKIDYTKQNCTDLASWERPVSAGPNPPNADAVHDASNL